MAEDEQQRGSTAASTTGGQDRSGEEPQQAVQISKIYLKDVSFEAPETPGVFRGEWRPDVNIELSTSVEQIDETAYESVLTITVTVKNQESTAYICEVKQAGIFRIRGFEGEARGRILGAYCPSQLFPFARQAISDLVVKGGFPQLLLAPVNFEALHAQEAERQRAQARTQAEAASSDGQDGAQGGEPRG